MEIKSSIFDNGDKIVQLRSTANILRNEMMEHQDWSFSGSFEDFNNPPLLQFFLTHLLFGRHVHRVSEMRNTEVDKIVDVSCQFLIQNSQTDRQVKHQPKKDCVISPNPTDTTLYRLANYYPFQSAQSESCKQSIRSLHWKWGSAVAQW